MQKRSISHSQYNDPYEGPFPLEYVDPNPEFIDFNAYRYHDRKRGLLTEVKTVPQSTNAVSWFMLLVIFIPHLVAKWMVQLVVKKGNSFWSRVASLYETYKETDMVGLYSGYCGELNENIHAVFYSSNKGFAMDVMDKGTSENRIALGHIRQNGLEDGKEKFLVKQTFGGADTPIQEAKFGQNIFEIYPREAKKLTATCTTPKVLGLKLYKLTKKKVLIMLISYCLSLLIELLPVARNEWIQKGEWIELFKNIMDAMHQSASYTKAVYSTNDMIYEEQHGPHFETLEENKEIAKTLALRSTSSNDRSTIGVANHVLMNDIRSVVKPPSNSTSSES